MASPSTLEILRSYDWFAAIEPEVQDAMVRGLRVRQYEEGEIIFHAGAPATGIWTILDGEARTYTTPRHGRAYTSGIFLPGHWFGAAPAVLRTGWPATAKALGPTTAGLLPLRDIDEILVELPALGWRLAQLCARLAQSQALFFAGLMGGSPVQRLSATLRAGATEVIDGAPAIRITQAELAAVVGASRQRMNAILNDLESDGRVERRYGVIRILDPSLMDLEA